MRYTAHNDYNRPQVFDNQKMLTVDFPSTFEEAEHEAARLNAEEQDSSLLVRASNGKSEKIRGVSV